MQTFFTWGLRFSIPVYAVLHFFTYAYSNKLLFHVLSFSGFFIFFFAMTTISVKKFKLPLALFLFGAMILLFSDISLLDGLFNGFQQMRDIIGLLVVVPLISWVLNEEPYMEALMSFAHKMLNTSRKFYFGMIAFTQIIAYFLLFGAIPMMYQFVNMILKNEEGEAWENYKGTALLRGFALSVMWVVSIPSFIFVVDTLSAPLWISILQGMGISICGMVVALIFSHFEEKRYGKDLTAGLMTELEVVLGHETSKKETNRKAVEFLLLFVSLFGTIFLLNSFLTVGLMLIIPLVVLVWTFLFFLIKKRPEKFIIETQMYLGKGILSQSYQLCVMLGAGMMIYALNQTRFADFVIHGIQLLQEVVPLINILFLLPFMVIVLGFFGLGPLTVMVLVGGILGNLALPFPPELIVLAVTSGSAISILLSPLIMPVIVLSASNGLSGFINGIKFNWKYALVIYIVVQVYIQTMVLLW